MIESLYLQGSPITVSILRPVTNGLRYRTRTMVPWGLGWLRCFVVSTLLQRVTPPSTTFPARINLRAQVCIAFHSFGEVERNDNSITYLMTRGRRPACHAASRLATKLPSILWLGSRMCIDFAVSSERRCFLPEPDPDLLSASGSLVLCRGTAVKRAALASQALRSFQWGLDWSPAEFLEGSREGVTLFVLLFQDSF